MAEEGLAGQAVRSARVVRRVGGVLVGRRGGEARDARVVERVRRRPEVDDVGTLAECEEERRDAVLGRVELDGERPERPLPTSEMPP